MDNIVYRVISRDDEEIVRSIVCEEFLANEPLSMYLSVDPEKDGRIWCDTIFPTCCDNGLSMAAFNSNTNEMVGFRLSAIVCKETEDVLHFSKEDPKTRNMALLYESVDALYRSVGMTMFQKYGVEELVNFRGLSVAKKYQRQGIATELVKKSLDLVKSKGFKLVTTETTSKYSRQIYCNLGFETVVEIPYEDLVLDGNHIKLTENISHHKSIALFAKQL